MVRLFLVFSFRAFAVRHGHHKRFRRNHNKKRGKRTYGLNPLSVLYLSRKKKLSKKTIKVKRVNLPLPSAPLATRYQATVSTNHSIEHRDGRKGPIGRESLERNKEHRLRVAVVCNCKVRIASSAKAVRRRTMLFH